VTRPNGHYRPVALRGTLLRVIVTVTSVLGLLLACSPGGPQAQQIAGQNPVTTPSVPPGLRGRLLMTRDLGLWTLDLATARLDPIMRPPEMGQVLTGRWSPDGTRIAYAMFMVKNQRTPASEVVVVNADGSAPRQVLSTEGSGVFYQAPVWDPDGRHLYVLHLAQTPEERIRRIARVDIESGEITTVTDEIGVFDVSPDGRWLAAIHVATTGAVSITLLDLQSNEQRMLVAERQFDNISVLRFDPTSQAVIFSGSQPGVGVAPQPGLGDLARQLLGFPTPALAHGPPQDIYRVPVAGGTPTRMLPLQADEPVATYSPDGANLAIFSIEALSVMPAAGGTRTTVLSPGGAGSIDWAR
jgi:Tol biopolymer transport system component